jgi:hypothetical protein
MEIISEHPKETRSTTMGPYKLEMMDATDLEIYGEALIEESHHRRTSLERSHARKNRDQSIVNLIAGERSLLFVLCVDGSFAVSQSTNPFI